MMVVDVEGRVVSTRDIETRHLQTSSDMGHPPADQVALGNRLASELPNQFDFPADDVCSGVPRGRCRLV
jgi:hypothetical protein